MKHEVNNHFEPLPIGMEDRARADADRLLAQAFRLVEEERPDEAVPLFERLHAMQPFEVAHAINLGNARLACADTAGAISAFDEAERLGADGIACWLGHGLALLASRRFREAGQRLGRAYRAQPRAPDVALGWAQYLVEMECFDEARRCMSGVDTDALSSTQRRGAAWVLAQCGLEEDASRLFRACLEESPGDDLLRLQYVLLLERLNRLDEAGEQLRAVRDAQADAPMRALAMSRLLRRNGQARAALDSVRGALSLQSGDEMSAQLHFEAARLHDQLGDPDAAMSALAHAHGNARRAFACRHPGTDRTMRLGWLDQRLHAPAPDRWRRPLPDGGPRDPVFLVGFPRSGTTLLQHILAMHPDIRVAEEKPVLEDVIASLQSAGQGSLPLLARLDAIAPERLAALRAMYWHGMADHTRDDGRRLLDKYPLSLTRIPYIARLFPASHTLCLLRHPCDVVLSCYMQAFGLNGGALAFASLASTAQAYAQVMSYWEEQKQRVGCAIHALRYEDLVADFEGTMQGVVRFLGFPWCDGFRDFHQRARRQAERIRTPSYAQVIRPVDAAAVHRWRGYRRYFEGDVLELLSPWAERYGYSLE
ncbi:tetratricopeptide repeat-containing sulfotransferase family protein [Pseudoxanthomonas putridarboris]|uniref:Sulfotransferase n=1 Tax=Pseudoxanthomonas putridarboris TaxID=752605 RepID=A0ABU9J323_9GAMM